MSIDDLIASLLEKRGIKTQEDRQEFFNPPHPLSIPLEKVGLDPVKVKEAIQLVASHVSRSSKIAVYGDYDVDGISSTAILWEVLYRKTKEVFPHIPHRREEGYGLSRKGIDHCLQQGAKLIITVDSGIVANDEIAYCREKGCDVIVIDHHEASEKLPPASVLIHSTRTSAAGLAWFFIREFAVGQDESVVRELLSLSAISVICDLVPLLGINRAIARHGLVELNKTTRPGLLSLFSQSGIELGKLGTYEVGFVIGPRINAMGRLEHALDSLRLLCTPNPRKAQELAARLSSTNQARQDMTHKSSLNAIASFDPENLPKILLAASPDYDEGIIGLIASKLVEKYSRPAIAVNIGQDKSKGSVRSVPGFHITDFLRSFDGLFDSIGGHSMAAGFTISTDKLDDLRDKLLSISHEQLPDSLLVKNRKVEAEVDLSLMSLELFRSLSQFEPFGLGNSRPVFHTPGVEILHSRMIGKNYQHMKFMASSGKTALDAIYFNSGVDAASVKIADLYYCLDLNTFNGQSNLQLMVRDLVNV